MDIVKMILGSFLSAVSLINFGYMAVQTDNALKMVLVLLSILLTAAGMYVYAEGANDNHEVL